MKKVLPILFIGIMLFLNVLKASASEKVLSGVGIKNHKDSYTIELTSTEPARISKTIISANRVLVNIDNMKVSKNLATKYDNNTVIDNVIIEPQGKNISIMLQGDNIAYSDIIFKEPTSLQQIEDNISNGFTEITMGIIGQKNNKTIPCVFLILLLGILVSEVKFIRSKYKELDEEKSLLQKDIERTSEFKEYMVGFGNQGLQKPYTTPIYTNPKDTSLIRANYLKRLKTLQTPETVTLNSILSNTNQETDLIDKIVNNKPVFGSLSSVSTNQNAVIEKNTVTNPVSKSQLKSQLQYLETLSKLYRQTSEGNDTLQKRLNGLY